MTIVVTVNCMNGQVALEYCLKSLIFCTMDKITAHGFGMTWGGQNFHSIPLRSSRCCGLRSSLPLGLPTLLSSIFPFLSTEWSLFGYWIFVGEWDAEHLVNVMSVVLWGSTAVVGLQTERSLWGRRLQRGMRTANGWLQSLWELCPWETPGACELSRPPALLCCHREVSGQWERGSPECAINSLTGCGQCQS